jgi:hypothetical protein
MQPKHLAPLTSAAGQDIKVVFEFATDANGSVYRGVHIADGVVEALP